MQTDTCWVSWLRPAVSINGRIVNYRLHIMFVYIYSASSDEYQELEGIDSLGCLQEMMPSVLKLKPTSYNY